MKVLYIVLAVTTITALGFEAEAHDAFNYDYWDAGRDGFSYQNLGDYLFELGYFATEEQSGEAPTWQRTSLFISANLFWEAPIFRGRGSPEFLVAGGIGVRGYMDITTMEYDIIGNNIEWVNLDFDSALFLNAMAGFSVSYFHALGRFQWEADDWRLGWSIGIKL